MKSISKNCEIKHDKTIEHQDYNLILFSFLFRAIMKTTYLIDLKLNNILILLIIIIVINISLVVPVSQACKEKPIELNVDNADIILAGTVRKLERNYSLTQYGAYVEVHRVIKGNHLIYDVYNTVYENPYQIEMQKNLSKRTHRQQNSISGQIIFVYNFGDTNICSSKVSPHDVRIFLLSVDTYKRLYLNSSLIEPTLTKARNLNTISENEITYSLKICKFKIILVD